MAALRVVESDPVVSFEHTPDTPSHSPHSPHRVRIIDATLACLARHGTAKTTVDDIARQAGVSRATVYRAFPGGTRSSVPSSTPRRRGCSLRSACAWVQRPT
jgi:AraC-like DNA-binding protein